MSWAATYPPRSRSRSPRARIPYPDSAGYPQDPYRTDWDAYDRDRAWASYERDRAAYEYGRRGRSRSPPPDESTGARTFSFSLADVAHYLQPVGNEDVLCHLMTGTGMIRARVITMITVCF